MKTKIVNIDCMFLSQKGLLSIAPRSILRNRKELLPKSQR